MRVSTKEMHIIKEYEYPLNLFKLAYEDIDCDLVYSDKMAKSLKVLVEDIGKIKEKAKQIIELKCINKYDNKQVSSLLGVGIERVKIIWSWCIRKLRNKYSVEAIKVGVEEWKRKKEQTEEEELRVDKESYSHLFIQRLYDSKLGYDLAYRYVTCDISKKDSINKTIEKVLSSLEERRLI